MTHQEDAVNDVLVERDRQDELFGVQNHHPAYWLALLGKQSGQLGAAIVQREWANPLNREKMLKQVRNEAIQLTAVGLAFIEAIDRGEVPVGLTTAQPSDPRQRAKAIGHGDEQIRYTQEDDSDETLCYHCELPIARNANTGWAHVNSASYHTWVNSHPSHKHHDARWEPPCIRCGRDNANGTHDALSRTGHLDHEYQPRALAVAK